MFERALAALVAALLFSAGNSFAATDGVTSSEILIGTIQDLSGPIVSISRPVLNGMTMRLDEINAAGGVNGRKLRLRFEDSGYDPKKAVLATQKLLSSDHVFAMLATTGTSVALASAPLVVEAGVPQLLPISAHRANFEPFQRLKFALLTPFEIGTNAGLNAMLRRGDHHRAAIFYQDDELGLSILRTTEEVLKAAGVSLVEKTSYKRGATDFTSQMQLIYAAKPDLIVLGSAVRETVGAVAAVRQLGYAGDIVGSQGTFVGDVPKIGGAAVEGLFAVSEYPMMYPGDAGNSPALAAWIGEYQRRFGSDPDIYSATGWVAMDIFAEAARKAGPDLTVESFLTALESMTYPTGFLGNPAYAWSPTNHLGGTQVRLAQVKGGRWTIVSDYLSAK